LKENGLAAMVPPGVALLRVEPVEVDGTAYETLQADVDGVKMQLLFDTTSMLLDRMTIDLKNSFEQQGIPAVKSAAVTIDYTRSAAGAALPASGFEWSPPADATDINAAQTEMLEDDDEGPATREGARPDDAPDDTADDDADAPDDDTVEDAPDASPMPQ
jgi:hypothetical protein